MNKKLLSASISLILASTIGCGGGGGGGGSSDSPADAPAETTISGKASKGIISGGLVTAYELSTSGAELGSVGTATTGSDGSYSITLNANYKGGPIKLAITATSDTRMKCDALAGCGAGKAFGEALTLPEGFKLNAIVAPKPAGGAVTTQITPFSHMATARALKEGNLTETSVQGAISEVSQIVGVNIQTTDIADITDDLSQASDDAKELALFSAGLAKILLENPEEIATQLDKLATSFEDGAFKPEDEIGISAILEAVRDTTSEAELNEELRRDLAETINDLNEVIEVISGQISEDGSFDPKPSDNAAATEVEQAKALLTDARTFLQTIADNYDSPLNALDLDAQTASDVLSGESATLLDLVGEAIAQATDDLNARPIDLANEFDNPGTYETIIVNENRDSIGTLTSVFSSTDAGIAITMNGTLSGTGTNTVTITNLILSTSLTKADITFGDTPNTITQALISTDEKVVLTGEVSANNDTSVTFEEVSVSLSSSTDSTVSIGDINSEQTALDKITGVEFDGDVTIKTANASFNGTLGAKLVALADDVESNEPLSISGASLSGKFSSDNGSFEASASLDITNARSFDVFGYLDYESEIWGYEYITGANAQFAVPIQTAKILGATYGYSNIVDSSITIVGAPTPSNSDNTTVSFQYLDGNVLRYDTFAGNFWSQIEPYAKTALESKLNFATAPSSLDLYYVDYNALNDSAWIEYKATFADPESVDSFLEGQLTITSKLASTGLPDANVTLSVDRTELDRAEATMIVAYNGQSYTIEADSKANSVKLSNPDGVSIALEIDPNSEDISGTAKVGDKEVGNIETTNKGLTIIRYNDGSFESLF